MGWTFATKSRKKKSASPADVLTDRAFQTFPSDERGKLLMDKTLADVKEEQAEPAFLQKALGLLDAVPAMWRSVTDNTMRGNLEDHGETKGGLVASQMGKGLFGTIGYGIDALAHNTWDKPENAYNPLTEAGKSLHGDVGAGDHLRFLEDYAKSDAASQTEKDILDTESGKFWTSLAFNVLDDPSNLGTAGISAATKGAKAAKMMEVAAGGLSKAKLAGVGIDVAKFAAKHNDEFLDLVAKANIVVPEGVDTTNALAHALEGGKVPLEMFSPDAAHEISKAAGRFAGEAGAGTKRMIGVSGLWKTDEGVKVGGWMPALRDLTEAEAANALRLGTKEGKRGGTLLERMGKAPTVIASDAVKQGEKVTIGLGTRGVDKGGFKLMGQTVLDVQPYMDDLTYNIGKFMRGNAGTRTNALGFASELTGMAYRPVAQLFSRYAKVDEVGNKLLSAMARGSLQHLNDALNAATQLSNQNSLDLARRMTDRDAFEATVARTKMFDRPDELTAEVKLHKEQTEAAYAVAKRDGLYKEGGAEALLEREGGLTASRAAGTVAPIEEQQADLLDQMAEVRAVVGMDTARSDTLRAAAAAQRGEAKGTKRAVREADRAIADSMSEATLMADRQLALGQKSLDAGYVPPAEREAFDSATGGATLAPGTASMQANATAAVPSAAAVEKAPADVDTFIARTFGDASPEAEAESRRITDAITSYLDRHDAYIDDAGELGEEIRSAVENVPELRARVGSYRKANRHNPNKGKRAVGLPEIHEAVGSEFPDLGLSPEASVSGQGLTHADFLSALQTESEAASNFQRATDDILEQEGAVDGIRGALNERINAALDAGAKSDAVKWQALADDFESLVARSYDPEPLFPQMAATKRTTTAKQRVEQRIAVRARAEQRAAVKGAYKGGRATGWMEGSRAAGRDMVRNEARAAKAQGRAARYADTVASLTDESERTQAAYLALRKLETEYKALENQRRTWTAKLDKAGRRMDRAQSSIDEYLRLEAEAMATQQRILDIAASADYGKARQHFLDVGYTPERADELVAILQEQEQVLKATFDARHAAGIGEPELLPGQGSKAYNPQVDIEARGPIKRRGWFKGDKEKIRDEILMREYGVTLDDLTPPERARLSVFGKRSMTPQEVEERVFKTMQERIEAGMSVETDIRVTDASKIRRDLSDVAKAKFQDSVVESIGIPLRAGTKDVPSGYVVQSLTRGGKTQEYLVPQVAAEWIDAYGQTFLNDEALNILFRGFDRLQNAWKRTATVDNPLFHVRNAMSNWVLAFFKGFHDPQSWSDGYRALAAHKAGVGADFMFKVGDEMMNADDLFKLVQGPVVRGNVGMGDVSRIAARMQKQEIPQQKLLKEIARSFTPSKVGSEVGEFTEDGARVSTYLAARAQGLDHASASLIPDRVLYNYTPQGFTKTEMQAFKRAIPFYGWMRNHIPSLLETMAKSPSKVNIFTKIRSAAFTSTETDPSTLPEWMRSLGSFPLPGVRNEDGHKVMFAPSMIPTQDVGRLGSGIGDLLSMTSPIAKEYFEQKINYDLYYGRSIESPLGEQTKAPGYVQAIDAIAKGIPGWESFKKSLGFSTLSDTDANGEVVDTYVGMAAKPRKFVKDMLPFIENIGKIVEPGANAIVGESNTKNAEYAVVSYFTGLKPTDFDQAEFDAAKQARLKSLLEERITLLRQKGEIPQSDTASKKKRRGVGVFSQ